MAKALIGFILIISHLLLYLKGHNDGVFKTQEAISSLQPKSMAAKHEEILELAPYVEQIAHVDRQPASEEPVAQDPKLGEDFSFKPIFFEGSEAEIDAEQDRSLASEPEEEDFSNAPEMDLSGRPPKEEEMMESL